MSAADDKKNPEDAFLHDIASPIAVAIGLVDLVLDDASDGSAPLNPGQKKRIEKAQASLLKLQAMMADRRKILSEKSK